MQEGGQGEEVLEYGDCDGLVPETPVAVEHTGESGPDGPPPLPPKSAGPRWQGFFIVLAIVWSMELFVGILVAAISFSIQGFPDGGEPFVPEAFAVLVTSPLSILTTLLACWYFACRRQGKTLADGLYLTRVPKPAMRVAVALGLGWAIVGGFLMTLLSTGESVIGEMLIRPSPDNPDQVQLYYPLFLLFMLAPLYEEIYYRGFIYSVLQRVLNSAWAFGIVVVWFGLLHAPQLAGDPWGIPVVLTMGAMCTWLRYRYDSITPAIVCHGIYNLVMIVATVVQVELYNRGIAL